jgi:hypothetical protein
MTWPRFRGSASCLELGQPVAVIGRGVGTNEWDAGGWLGRAGPLPVV